MNLGKLRTIANRELLKHQQAVAIVRTEKKAREKYRERLEAAKEAQSILQTVAASIQTKAHERITTIVTKCLRTVFGAKYEFRINFVRKRGKTEARMCYVCNGVEVDPVNDDSGGVLDVSAFALRISALLLATPKRRRVVITDEPFRNVHGEQYRERLVTMLETLSRDLKAQIIYATGLEWLRGGKIVEVDR